MRSKYPPIFLTEQQLFDILKSVGVNIVSETSTELIGYCPFHHNVDSPAFNISKRSPFLWKCWNGKCDQRGNIISLLLKKGYSSAEAKRMLISGSLDVDDLSRLISEILEEDEVVDNEWENVDFSSFRGEGLDRAREYAISRGITEEAFEFFHMGYSSKRDMLMIPAYDARSNLIGVIGRSIDGKQYRYSSGLARGATIWNIQNAIKEDRSIILTEGALDSVYIWQAGFKNVGAILGSAVSDKQWKLLRTYFDTIYCFFDNDEAGINCTAGIVKNISDLGVFVPEYSSDVKDPGGLTKHEIKYMLEEAKPSISLYLSD
jgi:DNA primase